MAKQLKTVTTKEVIAWLKKTRKKAFPFLNQGRGCLFTQYMRYKTGLKKCTVGYGGHFFATANTPLYEAQHGLIPFHDVFWNKTYQTKGVVTRQEAIHRLEALYMLEKMRKKLS